MGRKDSEGRSDVEKFRKTIGEALIFVCFFCFCYYLNDQPRTGGSRVGRAKEAVTHESLAAAQ